MRLDTHLYQGYELPVFYDSLVAKVIVWALTWEDLLNRGERALRDMGLYGIRTTIPYYLEILHHPEFRSGKFNTGFVEAHPELTQFSQKLSPEELALVLAAATAVHTGL